MVDDGLVIEPDADATADHNDAEAVPLPDGAVGAHEGIAAGEVLALFQRPPEPFAVPWPLGSGMAGSQI